MAILKNKVSNMADDFAIKIDKNSANDDATEKDNTQTIDLDTKSTNKNETLQLNQLYKNSDGKWTAPNEIV